MDVEWFLDVDLLFNLSRGFEKIAKMLIEKRKLLEADKSPKLKVNF